MKKLIFAFAALILCSPASAIPTYTYPSAGTPPVVPLQCTDSYTVCAPVISTNPMPVTISGTGTGTAPVVGNVASGATDSGAPVKIGCKYNASAITLTDGQRGDCQVDASGVLRVRQNHVLGTDSDANSNALIAFAQNYTGSSGLLATVQHVFNGTSWDRALSCPNTAAVSVTAGNTTEIVALTASQVIRICSIVISTSLAGTAQFIYGTGTNCGTGTTNISGAINLATATPLAITAAGGGSLMRSASANAFCIAAVTGNVSGFITYAKF